MNLIPSYNSKKDVCITCIHKVFLSSKSEATSTVKLGDFGLGAILRSDGAAPSTYVGTKQYTAPVSLTRL